MQEMIKSIYNTVNEVVSPFKTLYPYQDIEADVDSGVVSFAPIKIKNITLAGEELQADNSLIVDAVSEVCFEVDVYKTIKWDNSVSAFDTAEKLQTYLKSSEALDSFYQNYQYSLMPIWSDIEFSSDFATYKKWVQIARFEMFITKMSKIVLSDIRLKNIEIDVKEISMLESNPIYNRFADKFLKTI